MYGPRIKLYDLGREALGKQSQVTALVGSNREHLEVPSP